MRGKIASLVVCLLATMAFAQTKSKAEGKMIHVDFVSTEGEGMTIQAAVPLTLVESVRDQVEEVLGEMQKKHNLDFAKIWGSVRDAGPTEFLSIDNKDAKIKVSTTQTHLQIYVDQKIEDQQIKVILPMALGDVLFAGKTLDMDKIINALLALEGQDLVTIKSDEINGRVWIE